MAGPEGDLIFPEIVDYVESALRVDDAIFRLTRERAVLVLADVDRRRAEEIVGRLLSGFGERYAHAESLRIHLGYFEVTPQHKHLTVKEVLPTVFASAPVAN
jgi:GGDEF domain-containing protein